MAYEQTVSEQRDREKILLERITVLERDVKNCEDIKLDLDRNTAVMMQLEEEHKSAAVGLEN